MAHAILTALLIFHVAVVPVFYPKLSGIHAGDLTVSNAPAWRHVLRSGELEQPDGVMVICRFRL